MEEHSSEKPARQAKRVKRAAEPILRLASEMTVQTPKVELKRIFAGGQIDTIQQNIPYIHRIEHPTVGDTKKDRTGSKVKYMRLRYSAVLVPSVNIISACTARLIIFWWKQAMGPTPTIDSILNMGAHPDEDRTTLTYNINNASNYTVIYDRTVMVDAPLYTVSGTAARSHAIRYATDRKLDHTISFPDSASTPLDRNLYALVIGNNAYNNLAEKWLLKYHYAVDFVDI